VIVVFPRQPVSISLYFFCDKIHIFFQVSQISAEVEVRFLTVLLISFNPLSLDNKTLCQEVKVIKNLVKVYVAPVSNLSERVTVLENLTAQVTLTVKNLTQTEEVEIP
jgi:hypothetical protein